MDNSNIMKMWVNMWVRRQAAWRRIGRERSSTSGQSKTCSRNHVPSCNALFLSLAVCLHWNTAHDIMKSYEPHYLIPLIREVEYRSIAQRHCRPINTYNTFVIVSSKLVRPCRTFKMLVEIPRHARAPVPPLTAVHRRRWSSEEEAYLRQV